MMRSSRGERPPFFSGCGEVVEFGAQFVKVEVSHSGPHP